MSRLGEHGTGSFFLRLVPAQRAAFNYFPNGIFFLFFSKSGKQTHMGLVSRKANRILRSDTSPAKFAGLVLQKVPYSLRDGASIAGKYAAVW